MLENELRRKLLAIVAIELVLVLVVGAIGLVAIARETETLGALVTKGMTFHDTASRMMIDVLQQRRYEKAYFLNFGTPKSQDEFMEAFKRCSADFDQQLGILVSLIAPHPRVSAEIMDKIEGLARVHEEYLRDFDTVVERARQDPRMTPQVADDLMEAAGQDLPDLEKDVLAVMNAGNRVQDMMAQDAIGDAEQARKVILATLLGAVLSAGLLGFWLARSIYHAFLRGRLESLSRQT